MGTTAKMYGLVLLVTLMGCGGGSIVSPAPAPAPAPAIHNEWTWTSGSSSVDQLGLYGTKGTTLSGNTPGARAYPSQWTDLNGNLWLFGGYGGAAVGVQGDLNDLWEFKQGKWTWINGSNQIDQTGVYGSRGVPSPGNVPGGRYQATSWRDTSGNFWLFGGLGIDSNGTRGDLNDLWEYSGGQWTWMGGSNTVSNSAPGVYGTKGVTSSLNLPGARVDAASWSDPAGNLWLFGGFGYDSVGALGDLNDLWRYSGGEWTWIGGSATINALGLYGAQGVPSATNTPGARANPVTWVDAAGDLWLFGGQGNDMNDLVCQIENLCILNDLWRYNNGEWTWMGGSDTADAVGVYGTQGTSSVNNIPGARWGAVSWVDGNGDFWMFGGFGFDSTTGTHSVYGDLSDLWEYKAGQWTWIQGANIAGQVGSYGTLGSASSSSFPGARDSAAGWTDGLGKIWLFGGEDSMSGSLGGKFNDLWSYQP